jgi:hypothetical protein
MKILNNSSINSTNRHAFYQFSTTSGSPLYIHMKTNMYKNSSCMACVEAEGYNYGMTLPILCSWVWYNYSGDDYVRAGVKNYYSGLTAHGLYYASDGYTVLRAYSDSLYFCGFILNQVTANPVGAFNIQITAAIQTDNSGNYY